MLLLTQCAWAVDRDVSSGGGASKHGVALDEFALLVDESHAHHASGSSVSASLEVNLLLGKLRFGVDVRSSFARTRVVERVALRWRRRTVHVSASPTTLQTPPTCKLDGATHVVTGISLGHYGDLSFEAEREDFASRTAVRSSGRVAELVAGALAGVIGGAGAAGGNIDVHRETARVSCAVSCSFGLNRLPPSTFDEAMALVTAFPSLMQGDGVAVEVELTPLDTLLRLCGAPPSVSAAVPAFSVVSDVLLAKVKDALVALKDAAAALESAVAGRAGRALPSFRPLMQLRAEALLERCRAAAAALHESLASLRRTRSTDAIASAAAAADVSSTVAATAPLCTEVDAVVDSWHAVLRTMHQLVFGDGVVAGGLQPLDAETVVALSASGGVFVVDSPDVLESVIADYRVDAVCCLAVVVEKVSSVPTLAVGRDVQSTLAELACSNAGRIVCVVCDAAVVPRADSRPVTETSLVLFRRGDMAWTTMSPLPTVEDLAVRCSAAGSAVLSVRWRCRGAGASPDVQWHVSVVSTAEANGGSAPPYVLATVTRTADAAAVDATVLSCDVEGVVDRATGALVPSIVSVRAVTSTYAGKWVSLLQP
jgi:hypothetical protein